MHQKIRRANKICRSPVGGRQGQRKRRDFPCSNDIENSGDLQEALRNGPHLHARLLKRGERGGGTASTEKKKVGAVGSGKRKTPGGKRKGSLTSQGTTMGVL